MFYHKCFSAAHKCFGSKVNHISNISFKERMMKFHFKYLSGSKKFLSSTNCLSTLIHFYLIANGIQLIKFTHKYICKYIISVISSRFQRMLKCRLLLFHKGFKYNQLQTSQSILYIWSLAGDQNTFNNYILHVFI